MTLRTYAIAIKCESDKGVYKFYTHTYIHISLQNFTHWSTSLICPTFQPEWTAFWFTENFSFCFCFHLLVVRELVSIIRKKTLRLAQLLITFSAFLFQIYLATHDMSTNIQNRKRKILKFREHHLDQDQALGKFGGSTKLTIWCSTSD